MSAVAARMRIARPRRASFRRVKTGTLARWLLSVAIFFGVWEIIGQSGILIAIIQPSTVLPDLADSIVHGDMLGATLGTLMLAGAGFGISAVLGVGVGILVGSSRKWASVLDPLVNASIAAPIAMFIPVIAVYLGLEFKAKVVGVVLFAVFTVIINTATGIREVPSSGIEMARAFGTKERDMYRRIVLPWASPYIITGLRIAVGRCVEGAILFELFLRAQNLGLVIRNAAGSYNLSTLLGAVFFVTVIAAGMMGIARIIEWHLLRWKTG